ncbi:MAG: hypothetical protein P8P66_13275 [Paracoccaceae bacterium]|nr:hypothetical protein [Thalassobium sp. R2A62]MDG1340944.1 hypothetical protein [Paracoccaceae bacterium]MDG1802735.1 hypothetical protein [Paracoccaceae bacterium]MDG2453690.1 hypothetical protein [Paracoccaceae bacterium]
MKKGDGLDPKGLIFESYRIDGITAGECRSIFLDWALSLPQGANPRPLITDLLARYGTDHAQHPMTAVLTEGLASAGPAKRRGGRAARVGRS